MPMTAERSAAAAPPPSSEHRASSEHTDEATSATGNRPLKKLRFADHDSNGKATASSTNADTSAPPARLVHPFGVKPIGNYFEDVAKGVRECRGSGMGKFACLSDIHMLDLLNWLAPADLCSLTACSRACYVFGSHDELWRTLVLEEMEGNFTPKQTWKQSYIATTTRTSQWSDLLRPIKVAGFYSDLLFQAFYCANAPIEASWICVENIDRRSANELSVAEFKAQYEVTNLPVILTDCITDWPAISKWTDEYLVQQSKTQTFSAGGFQLSMEQYLHYSRTLTDDQPLFIFDKEFAVKTPVFAADYKVPTYFQEDFFALLGDDKRPDHRWLIIGPEKSGSSFHIDPNSTNAWNGVIRGAKKWILFPPEIIPPGVHPSDDGGDVSTPVSLIEWFVTFYPQVKKLPLNQRPLEGICRKGEIIFVPNGWWHLVLNTEESIAITQNFVCTGNVKNVVRFLEEKPDQVSGLPCEARPLLAKTFRETMGKHQSELLTQVDLALAQEKAKKNRKSKWELLLQGEATPPTTDDAVNSISEENGAATTGNNAATSFSFGFSF